MTSLLSFLSFRLHTLNVETARLSRVGRGGFGPAAVIVPRSHCRFERLFMARRDKNGRKAALLQSLETSPHEETGHFLHRQDQTDGPGHFSLWQWNDDSLRAALPRTDMVLIPESFAQEPLAEGVRLVKMVEGHEAQYWQNSELMSSRWWPHHPSERDWAVFLHGLAQDHSDLDTQPFQYPDEAITVPWRSDLSPFSTPIEATKPLLSPRRVGLVAAGLAAIMIAIPFGQSLRLDHQLTQLEQAIAEDPRDLDQLTRLRQETLENLNRLEHIRQLDRPADISDALLELDSVLGEGDIRLDGLGWGEDTIQIRLRNGPSDQLPDLIARLEALPAWTSVSARTDAGNSIIIEASLTNPQTETAS